MILQKMSVNSDEGRAKEPSQPLQKSRTNRNYTVIIVLVIICSLLIGGTLGYSLSNLTASGSVDDLQNQVKALEDVNNQMLTSLNDLRNQVSALETVNNTQYQVIPGNVSLSQLYQDVRDSIVMIYGSIVQRTFFGQQIVQVQGSGFVYNLTGRMVIVTNYHVIETATNIRVTFQNGDAYPADVLGSDAYSDLAILSVDAQTNEFKPLQIASSSTLEVGDSVIAVGNPFGLTGSMTTGIVSQLGRTLTESTTGGYSIANVIQISAQINPGNSGGPLLNDNGEVVGITTAIVSDSQGIGFAIPSNAILREARSLVNIGSYLQHPWLGIAGTDMTYEIANQMSINVTYGMLITQVTSGGPADKAGLKAGTRQVLINGNSVTVGGDVIAAINGTRIVNSDDLSTYLEEYTLPNQTITIRTVRNGLTLDIPTLLGTRPPPS